MTSEQLTAAGFILCTEKPGPHWPGNTFAPLYVRRLARGPAIYVQCRLERPNEVLAFVGDWARPEHYCQGSISSVEQLLDQLDLEATLLGG